MLLLFEASHDRLWRTKGMEEILMVVYVIDLLIARKEIRRTINGLNGFESVLLGFRLVLCAEFVREFQVF